VKTETPAPHVPWEVPELPPDPFSGEKWCGCNRPWKHARHKMPEVSADVQDVEARRVGERR